MEKVFVLGYLSDPTDDTSSSDVLGVYKTKEDAQSVMRNDFNALKDEYEITDEEIERFDAKLYEDEMTCTICHYGSYYEWNIYEFEI